ncbi:ERV/ALR sulfhydryl oxidase domain-containing protein [Massariosphaeria phaeospora]|uniref:Sulfhydryl oxidase n=1 Tax=Massariosphaeria phaeospora TaxID=100035 RepID=A0A7C8IG15_9PLEO|nr:ERV/ALR sulfhydryl oxidase domain-containing protein [Massariosphaeria phaeospora]
MARSGREQTEQEQAESLPATVPKGVVLGPDGKPCRTCTDVSSWMAMTKSPKALTRKPTAAPATLPVPTDCPPDVEALGRSSWTLLHSITATYPERPTPQLQSETSTFLHTFSKLYPCWHCASDFQTWMKEAGNAPRVSSRDDFGRWMCQAHNAVNVKLGKSVFDCERWEERWRTGWKDGRCD